MSSRRRREARAGRAEAERRADPRAVRATRRVSLAALAAGSAAAAIAGYLLLERLGGAPLVCGPFAGCDTVQASSYATIAGIPVAMVGAAGSIVVLILLVAWWLRRDPRALAIAYVLGLGGAVVLAYLTWLELVVIHAVCSWCVGYAVASLTTLGLVGWLVRRAT